MMGAPSNDATELHGILMDLGRHRSLRDPVGALCEDMQLTPPQAHTLMWLGEDGALTMGVLARRAGITEKTITGVVDRLEVSGLLERVRSEEDRRSVSVRLTPKGQLVYADLHTHLREGLDQVLTLLEPEDRCALFGVLKKLAQKLKQRAAAAVTAPRTGTDTP
jgi:DNA-binding MarR family transcriptional regulator